MIAKVGACCISVGLKPTMGGPAVLYEVSVGQYVLSGPFFGPVTIVSGIQPVASNLSRDQYADFIRAMNELWPAPENTLEEILKNFGQQETNE